MGVSIRVGNRTVLHSAAVCGPMAVDSKIMKTLITGVTIAHE